MAKPPKIADKMRRFIETRARGEPAIVRVAVFGSRARGDSRERSDYDLAFFAPALHPADWSRFALDFEENAPTLCHLDLVFVSDNMNRELREAIQSEGITVYDSAAPDKKRR